MNQPQSTKPGVMLYFEQLHSILDSGLSSDQIASVLAAIRNYSQYGEVPDFGQEVTLNVLWSLIQPSLDRDNQRYENAVTQRTNAINSRWWKSYALKNGIDPEDIEQRLQWQSKKAQQG